MWPRGVETVSSDRSMNSLSLFTFLCAISLHSVAGTSVAYPSIPGADSDDCSFAGDDSVLVPPRREVYDDGRIFDITHRYVPEMPVWDSKEGLGHFLWLQMSMKNGSQANDSAMKLGVHTGTHVDAPSHFYDKYFDAGFDVDSLDLTLLNGLALLVDVPRDKNVTAEVMKSLNIPSGIRRVLFRTSNTDKRLMFKKEFDTSYVGFKEDGAKWLVENTDIKLVGVDYLSAAAYDHSIPSHLVFLESREIILVEGLKLDDVPAGIYSLNCLPLRLVGSEASPIRCILIR
ncbi:cyclase-like protein 2 [Abrus precatorius]|uniref:Cyclase-like protein 2 n=1 Tax=Abrus precatorius TaxID=3816 RepID=A0A8B8MFP7_ABRPR|nr:cyclase-like protein 2 [Abrus precatorius]